MGAHHVDRSGEIVEDRRRDVVIVGGANWLDEQRLPMFFQNVYGGIVATVPAALTYRLALESGLNLAPGQGGGWGLFWGRGGFFSTPLLSITQW